jgi:enamine deaminase RidA (YjgF/YER057c/UK114 family)
MENIKARVEKLGYTMKDIVKCTVMIRDMSKWADFNAIYKTYFEPGKYPARSAMGVSGLALGAEMEVEAILYAPGK